MPTRFFSEHTITRQSQALESHGRHSLLRRKRRAAGRALPAPAAQLESLNRARNRQIALRVVRAYEGGDSGGSVASLLGKIGRHYVNNPITRNKLANKTIGRKGLLGAAEDLVKSSDPIALGETAARSFRHPLRAVEGKPGQISAGIIVGPGGFAGEGAGGVAGEFVRPRTRVEAQARLAEIDKQIEKTTKAVEHHVGHPLYGNDVAALRKEQLRRNKINGLIDLFEKKGERRRGTAKALRSGRKPKVANETIEHAQRHIEAAIKANPTDPTLQHFARLLEERNHLSQALEISPEEAFGTGPIAPKDYGSVPVERQTPAPMPKVEPVKVGDIPNLPGIERSPEEVRAIVAKSLGPARQIYAKQKAGYSAERSARVARGMKAYEEAGGGGAGHEAFMRAQRGALPKEVFDRLQSGTLTQADVDGLVRHAYDHPDLLPYEKAGAVNALRDAIEHKRVPAAHQIELLRRAYGAEVAQAVSHLPLLKQAGHYVLSALNVPRTVMASADVSAPFRQGLVAGAAHPVLFAKAFPQMFRALRSEEFYQGMLQEIHSRPNFDLYMLAGLKFTELGRSLNKREEQFQSDLAEKLNLPIPGTEHSVGPGHIVRASGRAYTGFLDKLRADIFDELYDRNRRAGRPVEDIEYMKGIARFVNSATGRGDLGHFESWAPALNAAFFSPRLAWSRINFLNPLWIARLPRGVRLHAARSILTLGLGAGLVLEAAHEALNANVNVDPRNADFAKLRFGNTRLDVLGGFQQYLRLGAQLYTGQIISSTTGKTLTLGHGFGSLSREDIIKRFLQAKESPPVAVIDDFLKGTTFAGAPVTVKQEVYAHLLPLVAQDAYDLYHDTGSLPYTLLGYGVSAFGVGLQTYGAKPIRNRSSGGGARSSSILQRSPSSGSSLLRSGGRSSPSLLRP